MLPTGTGSCFVDNRSAFRLRYNYGHLRSGWNTLPLTTTALEELHEAFRAFRYDEAEDALARELEDHVRYQGYVQQSDLQRRVSTRKKQESDILKKVDRSGPREVASLRELEHEIVTDIVGARVVLDYLYQVEELKDFITTKSQRWRVEKIEDNLRSDTGYRSLHVDVVLTTSNHSDVRCEIQVRTLLEHAFSTWTWPVYERYREAPASIPPMLRGQLVQISDLLNHVDKQAANLASEIRNVVQSPGL